VVAALPHPALRRAASAADARAEFESWIDADDYPCVMAKSVVKLGQYVVRPYARLGGQASARALARDLAAFGREPEPERGFRSFVAVFDRPVSLCERAFEDLLWTTLQRVHEADDEPWDPAVSSDPGSNEFSFSVGGRAFYVVGMHPGASRMARRFGRPLVAFNLHAQFEALREAGRYERVRDTIRARDRALQGTVNPALKDFGTQSEARQYAGRAVPSDWRCPFQPQTDGDRRAA
jgi:FPC/CPF motif-containing protein YcgG